MLLFSPPVNLSNITRLHYAGAAAGTYRTPSSRLTTGTTPGSPGGGTTVNTSISCTNCMVAGTLNLSNISILLVAAAVSNPDGTKDAFTLNSVRRGTHKK